MFGINAVGQLATSTLDAEFQKLDPQLQATIETVQRSLLDGLTPGQVVLIAAGVPVALKALQIVATYTDTHNQHLRARIGAKEKMELTAEEAAAIRASRGGKAVG